MWKVSRYLILIVVAGTAVVGFWIYQKYIKSTGPTEVAVTVERGNIEEIIRSQGEVVTSSEHKLEFASGGMVSAVYVKEGQVVSAGAPLMKLDTTELSLQVERLSSLVNQRIADLAKVSAGATPADIAVYDARVASADTALHEAQKQETLALRAVFTAMDDATKGTTDLFYYDPQSTVPKLSFYIPDSALQVSLQNERVALQAVLSNAESAAQASTQGDLHTAAVQMQTAAQRVGTFLDNNIRALNSAILGTTVNASMISAWQTTTAAARSALNTRASALAVAENQRTGAEAALALAQKELDAAKSPPRKEDVDAASAAVSEAQSQIKITQEQIRKATLVAPETGRVVKVSYKVGEVSSAGSPAVLLNALVPKVASDISELDIAHVREKNANTATITFDALPGKTYAGKVTSIEPQKIDKDGDTYYRVNFSLANADANIRPGMTADLRISVSKKTDVLKIPEYVSFKQDGVTYVRVEENGAIKEVPVELGISDGEYREVVTGLSEGQKVFIPVE